MFETTDVDRPYHLSPGLKHKTSPKVITPFLQTHHSIVRAAGTSDLSAGRSRLWPNGLWEWCYQNDSSYESLGEFNSLLFPLCFLYTSGYFHLPSICLPFLMERELPHNPDTSIFAGKETCRGTSMFSVNSYIYGLSKYGIEVSGTQLSSTYCVCMKSKLCGRWTVCQKCWSCGASSTS